MTKWLPTSLCVLILVSTAFPARAAQSAADTAVSQTVRNGEMKFSSKTELVLVPVLVTKGAGHVSGLRKEDFVLKKDGQAQQLAVFEEINASRETVLKKPSLPAGVYSNAQSDPAAKRLLVIALDGANTRLTDQLFARQQVIKFLSHGIPADTMISLVVIGRGRMRVVHNFTSNPQLLLAALSTVTRNVSLPISTEESPELTQEVDVLQDFVSQPLNEFVSGGSSLFNSWSQRFKILDTLAALQQIGQAYAGVPGRKALVWVTEGFPFNVDNSQLKMGKSAATYDLSDVQEDYEKTWRVLNQANVAVYPVDVRGLVNTLNIPASVGVSASNIQALQRQLNSYTSAQHANNVDRIATMDAFASMTGGRAYYNTNDLSGSFRKAAEDSSAYYLLGFYLNKNTTSGWHKLKVELARKEGHVRARSGFFSTPDAQPQPGTQKAEIRMAIESPLDFTGLPVYLKWQEIQPSRQPGKRQVRCLISVPAGAITVDEADNNHLLLETAFVARAKKHKDSDNVAQIINAHLKPDALATLRGGGFTNTYTLNLAPGEYSVRFVMRDDISGRLGSLTVPLVVK